MTTSSPFDTATSADPVDPFAAPGHEQVVFASDEATGLRAIIAIHSTALGPALGGTRFHPYPSTGAALTDALDLARGMSYKAALAGLDLGGGKAVILGDPARLRSEALLRAYGRFVQSLAGRYVTACDVGTSSPDMDHVARETDFVAGRTVAHGGAGDSSVLTAYGVFCGLRAAAEHAWPESGGSLEGRVVGVAGVGKVGRHLVAHLVGAGARVVVTDPHAPAVDRVRDEHPGVTVAGAHHELVTAGLDVYAPCALGHALTDDVVDALADGGARVVCGAANNQLAHPGTAERLLERGIVYAPDYCVNAGGLVQVADEHQGRREPGGFSFERAEQRAGGIYETTRRVLEEARRDGVTPATAADRMARARMDEVGRLRGIWLPR